MYVCLSFEKWMIDQCLCFDGDHIRRRPYLLWMTCTIDGTTILIVTAQCGQLAVTRRRGRFEFSLRLDQG